MAVASLSNTAKTRRSSHLLLAVLLTV